MTEPRARITETLARGLDVPSGLAVGQDAVFYTTTAWHPAAGARGDLNTGTLWSLKKSGGAPSSLAAHLLLPGDPAVDPDGSAVYVSASASVYRVSTSGGAPPRALYTRPPRSGSPVVIGVDDAHVYLRWWSGLGASQDGELVKVPKHGGAPIPFRSVAALSGHASDKHAAYCGGGVAFCWTAPPYTEKLIQNFEGNVTCDGITSEGSRVYWSARGEIHDSVAPTRVMVHAFARGLTLVGDYLYWFEEQSKGSWRIARTPKVLGIKVEELVTNLPHITAVAFDKEYAYWIDNGSGTLSRVRISAEPGGEAHQDDLPALRQSGDSVPSGSVTAAPGMVLVPPGEFTMGDDSDKDAKPARRVKMTKPFFIDTLEVTVADYSKCRAAGACTATSIHGPDVTDSEVEKFGGMCNAQYPQRGPHPVNCVDREQATAYCTSVGKRLPTEAEWEYAARGPDGRIYPWGGDEPKCDKAVVSGCVRLIPERASTKPGGSYPGSASPFGVLDMVGNVWEWVADGWGPYGAGAATDPSVPGTIALGVIRGGSWDFGAPSLKAFARRKFYAANGHVSTGFRCAKDAAP